MTVWEEITRSSEQEKKNHLSPGLLPKKDGPLHAIHWLEMRKPEVQEAIFKKGKKYLGLNFIFLMDMLLL